MNARLVIPALGVVVLAACVPKASVPDGGAILDEDVALVRGSAADVATREIVVDRGVTLVAIVDEKLTDVRVKLATQASGRNPAATVEVENNLGGAGVEVALLDVQRGRVTVTLTGPQNGIKPGSVHLTVRQYAENARHDARFSAQLMGYEAWSAATSASYRMNTIAPSGPEQIEHAIASLETPHGDVQRAAEARLVRAQMLQFFELNPVEARVEAQRAGQAFEMLPAADAVNAARARLVEARALAMISENPEARNPSAAEARQEARRILGGLSGPTSPLAPIGRARAFDVIAYIDRNDALFDDSDAHFRQAQELFHSVGYRAGEIEMSAELAMNLVHRGKFKEASEAFAPLMPDIARISNPKKRVSTLVFAARAEAMSGNTDEAIDRLLQVTREAAAFGMREQEGSAAQELGFGYWYRGDYLQAKAFLDRALQITREDKDMMGLSFTLQSSGQVARFEGDYAKAIELHREAVQISTIPIARLRARLQLGHDYSAIGRHPEAIAEMRAALAEKLQDPRHFVFNDVKTALANELIEHGDGSRATLAEAQTLVDDALQQCVELRDQQREIGARRIRAMLLTKQRKFAAARTEYDRTFALIFELRGTSANAQLRAKTMPEEQATFRGYFDLMLRQVAARGTGAPRLATADEEKTLLLLERARESRLGALRTGPMDAATDARINALLAKMADNSLKVAALLKRDLDAAESAELEKLQLDMASLRAELDSERTAAAEKLALQEKSGGVPRTWRALEPGVVQLSYALGNDHAYVWVRDAAGLRTAVLAESPEAIERELAELASLDRQKSPDKVERSLAYMSGVLLPAGLLPDQSVAVEIVAEGRIAAVPFAGLRSPKDPSRRLVETHAITMTTSLLTVEHNPLPKQARPFRLVALASGSGTLRSAAAAAADPVPKLQAAMAEVSAVADLFEAHDPAAKVKLLTGKDGNAASLRAIWSSGADVVHFATHALADLRQPLASLLVLPADDASGAATYLTAGQVESWRGDADLVFLSACESAVGPPRFAGGMPGLQSAFLRAGARGVIATLWPIEDVLAREFTADFYRRFTAGESATQALSETQRAWLAPRADLDQSTQLRRHITALAHGYYTL